MIKAPEIKSLISKYQIQYSLKSLLVLSNWDIETYMPQKGIQARGIVNSKVELHLQQLSLDPEYVLDLKAAKKLEDKGLLNEAEKAILWHLWHSYERYTKLPPKFVEEYASLTSTSSVIWSQAKKENNWKLFMPYLEKIFNMTKQYADYIGYKNHPYEALIEDYEPGLSIEYYESYFKALSEKFKRINLNKAKAIPELPLNFSVEKLKEVCSDILDILGADDLRIRLDESSHPFSSALSKNDVRLTTNYNKPSPLSAVYSTIHEFGHGLFGLQASNAIEFTPLFEYISYALHESQSRYWENIIGRSQEFIKWLTPKMNTLGKEYVNLTEKYFYDKINEVRPSLIRIEADELTYHYHILIRYQVEKALLEGSMKIADAQDLWNSKYMEYLGIEPKNPSEGILQDIHWSMGLIGYFPSYSFGTILASVLSEKIDSSMERNSQSIIEKSSIEKISNWLGENIHQFGGTYNYREVSKKFSGKEMNLEPWFRYISRKFNHLIK